MFTVRASGRLMTLYQEARTLAMRPGEKPSLYVLRARKIANNIRSLGHSFDDLSVCNMILNGLTAEYEQDVQLQEALCMQDPDLSTLQHGLELAYIKKVSKGEIQSKPAKTEGQTNAGKTKNERLGKSTPSGSRRISTGVATYAAEVTVAGTDQSVVKGLKEPVQSTGRGVLNCYHCGKPGHIRVQCPEYLESPQRKLQDGPPASHCVELEAVSSQPALPGWLIDSGSTDHISPCKDNMINYVEYADPAFLTVANGKKEKIVGEGTMQVFLETGNSIFLHNVKHVPPARSTCCL